MKYQNWNSMRSAPTNGSQFLAYHRVHGVVTCWFSEGYWTDDTPISPREYTGDMWIIGDDITQEEAEYIRHLNVFHGGSLLGWLPLDALPPEPEFDETEYDFVEPVNDEAKRCVLVVDTLKDGFG